AVVAVRWSKKADATVKRRPEKPWRRRRDSNPRQGYKPRYGLANRPRRPLEYSSAIAALIVYHEPVFLSNHLGPADGVKPLSHEWGCIVRPHPRSRLDGDRLRQCPQGSRER